MANAGHVQLEAFPTRDQAAISFLQVTQFIASSVLLFDFILNQDITIRSAKHAITLLRVVLTHQTLMEQHSAQVRKNITLNGPSLTSTIPVYKDHTRQLSEIIQPMEVLQMELESILDSMARWVLL